MPFPPEPAIDHDPVPVGQALPAELRRARRARHVEAPFPLFHPYPATLARAPLRVRIQPVPRPLRLRITMKFLGGRLRASQRCVPRSLAVVAHGKVARVAAYPAALAIGGVVGDSDSGRG